MESKPSFLDQIPSNSTHYYIWECRELRNCWDNLTIGESICSKHFIWNFPDSIGGSKWMLQLFPKGQYGRHGYQQRQANVYLRLIDCEHKQAMITLKFDLRTRIGYRIYNNSFNGSFEFADKQSRWIGKALIKLEPSYPGRTDWNCNTGILNKRDDLSVIISCKPISAPNVRVDRPLPITQEAPRGNDFSLKRLLWSAILQF